MDAHWVSWVFSYLFLLWFSHPTRSLAVGFSLTTTGTGFGQATELQEALDAKELKKLEEELGELGVLCRSHWIPQDSW